MQRTDHIAQLKPLYELETTTIHTWNKQAMTRQETREKPTDHKKHHLTRIPKDKSENGLECGRTKNRSSTNADCHNAKTLGKIKLTPESRVNGRG